MGYRIINLEKKVTVFVKELTGLDIKESDTPEKFILSLGNYDPIEIGFTKYKHPHIKNFRHSAHIKMIGVLSELLKSADDFEQWVDKQR